MTLNDFEALVFCLFIDVSCIIFYFYFYDKLFPGLETEESSAGLSIVELDEAVETGDALLGPFD